ncbi:anthranilate synthase family protein [Streptomyces sp. NPDC047928]|uniref:anthranilate synthase family protein n=1 Tax=unclassified Streptomyces TaxID=2593676 RepID=UPI003714FC6B
MTDALSWGFSADGSDVDLDALLDSGPPAFALLHRPGSATGPERVDVLAGDVTDVRLLADLPLPDDTGDGPGEGPGEGGGPRGARHELLAVVPFRQITERGFACRDDGEPVLALSVRAQGTLAVADAVTRIADAPVDLRDAGFDVDDDTYAETVRRVLADEIGRGAGSNFVIKRAFTATVAGWSPRTALAIFRRLLLSESGAHWTFVVHTGSRTFIGASPERHVSLDAGVAVMNPISGTYRYPESGPSLPGLMEFLADRKETDELAMVVDEELKMMARVCARTGGRVVGPRLKEMARLAHTEYFIEGPSTMDVRDVLRETLLAPTVTGSPLENACRVIARHEPGRRGYYSGVLALVGRDEEGGRALDSAILIRTADVDAAGRLSVGVGATLVRLSDAASEVAETRTKAAGLIAALSGAPFPARGGGAGGRLGDLPQVRGALAERNTDLAEFWLRDDRSGDSSRAVPALRGRRALIVDAEDTFTAMLAQHLRALGMDAAVHGHDEARDMDPGGYDVVVVGPGPGDPRDTDDPRIGALRAITGRLLERRIPFLSVCLGHQVLSGLLGLELIRRSVPNQGVQRKVDFFGRPEIVGFYNTFAARYDGDVLRHDAVAGPVEVCRDGRTGQVHALRAASFASLQFHPESLLTRNGSAVLAETLAALLDGDREGADRDAADRDAADRDGADRDGGGPAAPVPSAASVSSSAAPVSPVGT